MQNNVSKMQLAKAMSKAKYKPIKRKCQKQLILPVEGERHWPYYK